MKTLRAQRMQCFRHGIRGVSFASVASTAFSFAVLERWLPISIIRHLCFCERLRVSTPPACLSATSNPVEAVAPPFWSWLPTMRWALQRTVSRIRRSFAQELKRPVQKQKEHRKRARHRKRKQRGDVESCTVLMPWLWPCDANTLDKNFAHKIADPSHVVHLTLKMPDRPPRDMHFLLRFACVRPGKGAS